jgi:hypothetical protein
MEDGERAAPIAALFTRHYEIVNFSQSLYEIRYSQRIALVE